ncbi:OFA family MFS transporter [Bifidobacterium miconisargentati]|uniref:L-lactate MFS transporter n=1 Tax=Bifidobacterium miconisargentati TaxID=2834437 RepID=UPI001BDC4F49|nr:OFA family MFS transporter [Bifidobacterium miconisargentati]MBW3089441.1 OFA family MFS transporter [Bifidobacterium miconisargentati]
MSAKHEPNRYGVLSAAFVVMFFVASIALFSVFLNPLSEQHGWTPAEVSLSYSIFQTVMAVTGIFSGRISDKFGPRTVMLVGGFVFGLGWFLTGMADSLPMLYICHGLIAAVGNGLVYNPALTTAQRWFPDIRGKASGILLAAAAIGPATLAPVANALSSAFGVSNALRILGVTFWVTITLGSLFVQPAPADYRPKGWNPPVADKPAAATASAASVASDDDGSFDFKAMLASPRFYVLLAVYAMAASSGTMLVGAVSSISQEHVGAVGTMTAAAFGAMAVSISTISNFLGRLTFGALYDKFGAFKCLSIMLVVTALAMVAMSFAYNAAFFVACVIVLGFAFGALLVIYPPLTGETFGTKHLGVNYGIMFLGYALGAWIGPRLATGLHSEVYGYRMAFYAAAGITLLGLVIVLLLAARVRKAGTMMPPRK